MASIVYLIDDDESVRTGFEILLISARIPVQTFSTADEFLASDSRSKDACLVTDIKMRGMSGFELHEKLQHEGYDIPFIFVTGFDSPESRKQAKKIGACGYFCKPVDDQALLDAISWAHSKA